MTAVPTAQRRERIFSVDYGLGLATSFFFNSVFNGLLPVLPMYIALQGAQDWEIGLVMGAYGAAALVLRPLSGRFTDQYGAKNVMLAGIAIILVPTLLYTVVHSVPLLFLLRMAQGAGIVIFFTASTALVTGPLPVSRMGEGVGYLGVFAMLAGASAPPLAVWLVQQTDYSVFFWTCGLYVLLAFTTGAMMKPWRRTRVPGEPAPRLPLINRRALFPALIFFSFTVTNGAIYAFMPLFAAERDFGNPGLFFTALGITAMAVRMTFGRISDRYGRAVVIIPSLAMAVVAMWLLTVSTNQAMFLVSGLIYGVAHGGEYVGLMALTLDRTTEETRGSAIATFQWAFDIGSSCGAVALGLVASMVDHATIFFLAGFSPLIGLAAFLIVCRRAVRSPQLSSD